MKDKKKGLLLQTKKQMNNGAVATGLGFVLYMVLLVLGQALAADMVAIAFGVVGIYVSLSVMEARSRDKEEISYNLLWGQLALTIFLVDVYKRQPPVRDLVPAEAAERAGPRPVRTHPGGPDKDRRDVFHSIQ